jgi:4-amino-4-deoxy-L-arabinose transferase-like glycosyltransferase
MSPETAATEQVEVPTASHGSLRRRLLLIVLIGFVLRVGGMLAFGTYKFHDFADRYDFGFETGAIARSIVQGYGFSSPFRTQTGPTAWIAPVYPYFVAAGFKLFGLYTDRAGAVLLGVNALASAFTIWPMFLLGRRLFGRKVAIVSAWCWALAPPFMVWAVSWIWDTAFSALLLTVLLWLSFELAERSTTERWLLFGTLWGLAALMNPTLLSLAPFAFVYPMWNLRQRNEKWFRQALLSGIFVIALITPWLVRNYMVFHRPVFIRSNFWAEMRYGNSVYAKGTWMGWSTPGVNLREDLRYQQLGELPYIAAKKQEFMQFFHQYPEYFVELCARRVLFFWYGFVGWSEDWWTTTKNMVVLAFSVLAFVGMGTAVKRRLPGAFLVACTLLVFPVPYYLTYAYGRYKHPIEPVMLLLAVFAISQVTEFKSLFHAEDADKAD